MALGVRLLACSRRLHAAMLPPALPPLCRWLHQQELAAGVIAKEACDEGCAQGSLSPRHSQQHGPSPTSVTATTASHTPASHTSCSSASSLSCTTSPHSLPAHRGNAALPPPLPHLWAHHASGSRRSSGAPARTLSTSAAAQQPGAAAAAAVAQQTGGSSSDSATAHLAAAIIDEERRAQMTPAAIVSLLDRFIIGQADAKRAVAIALRNRWRRLRLPSPMKEEVMPKNILMIGPTGCGKTEIARRLAKLADAPFVKVEATKYTELGYVGRDVDDIIKDLVENAISLVRTRLRLQLVSHTKRKVEDAILLSLLGEHADAATVETFRESYRAGQLDDRMVEVPAPDLDRVTFDDKGALVLDKMVAMAAAALGGNPRPKDKKRMKVRDATAQMAEGEVERFLASDRVVQEAIRSAEQDGIVFIDEIDKVVEPSGGRGGGGSRGSVSSEGVQRDLLPIIEGSTVTTKFGNVSTDHVLFICSGAFHSCKPSDMLAELQGRLPIRVELKGLTAAEFLRILTEPQHNMIQQHQALLHSEGVELTFTPAALRATADAAEEANRLLDNIGARRLHTVLERILAEVSFDATKLAQASRLAGEATCRFEVDEAYVTQRMGELLKRPDLSRFII